MARRASTDSERLRATVHAVHQRIGIARNGDGTNRIVLKIENTSCVEDLTPFPSHAFEVLCVNKRLAVVSPPARNAIVPNPLDAPNNSPLGECAPTGVR